MLKISKSVVYNENQKPVAVQIPIEEFERMEEVIENYGLARLMDDVADDDQLSVQEAKSYYGLLNQDALSKRMLEGQPRQRMLPDCRNIKYIEDKY